MKKLILAGLCGLALTFGLVLAGCASLGGLFEKKMEVETETSRQLKDAAAAIVVKNQDYMGEDKFYSAFAGQFKGLRITSPQAGSGQIGFTYQDKNYLIKNTSVALRTGTVGARNTHVTQSIMITAITSCVELQKKAE
jgi:hypothetical protein